MMLGNKLGILDSAELAREEERIGKARAVELYGNQNCQYSKGEF